MNEIDRDQAPALAMPSRPEGRLTLRQFLRVVRDNTFATYPPVAFDEDIIAKRLLWRRRFIINEPNAVRHVVNPDSALLTSEGETWRRPPGASQTARSL